MKIPSYSGFSEIKDVKRKKKTKVDLTEEKGGAKEITVLTPRLKI